MERDTMILGGVAAVLGVMVVGLAYGQWSTSTQLAELQSRLDEVAPATASATSRSDARVRPGRVERAGQSGDGPVAARSGTAGDTPEIAEILDSLDEDPAAREQLEAIVEATTERQREARQQEWQQRMRDGMTEEIARFADEEGLDAETTEKVQGIVTGMMDTWHGLRDEVEAGDLTWPEAREEMRSVREETESKLVGLLGEDRYAVLEDRLPGGGRGFGGRGR